MSKKEAKTAVQTKKPVAKGELSEAALDKASGGALNAYKPATTEATFGSGGNGGAGPVGHIWVDKGAMGDGSV